MVRYVVLACQYAFPGRLLERDHSGTSTYNANIASLIASRADPDIILIDMENDAGLYYSPEPGGDMHDAHHPTARGYKKMAQLIVDEILRLEFILPATPLFLTGDPSGGLSPGEALYYNAHAAAVTRSTYALVNAPAGMTVDADHGLVEWPSASIGEYSFDLTATNGSGQTIQEISLSVGSSSDHGHTGILPYTVTHSNRRAQALVVPENGSIQSISMFHQGGTGRALFAVYADNSGSPGSKLGECPAFNLNASAGWQTQALSAPVQVTAGETIWLAWVYENPPVLHYDNGSPGRATTSDYYASGMPSDFGPSSVSNYIYSIYYTYIPGTAPETPPPAPAELTATASSSLVNLSWQHNQLNTDGYALERSFEGGAFQALASLSSSELSYADTDFSTPGNYTYRIAAFNSHGSSAFSNEVSIQVDPGSNTTMNAGYAQVFELVVYNNLRRAQQITLPQGGSLQSISMYHGPVSGNVLFALYSDAGDSPSSLLSVAPVTPASQSNGWQTINLQTAVSVTTGQKVWLAWVYENAAPIYYTPGTPGRASTSDPWTAGMPASFGSYSTSNYIYSICAIVTTDIAATDPPAPPENLAATHTTGTLVDISWDDISDNETGFILERRSETGTFGIISNPSSNATSY